MYYIFDCQGNIVGNPKGYRTIKGAIIQQNRHWSPANRAIWLARDKQPMQGPGYQALSSIKFIAK